MLKALLTRIEHIELAGKVERLKSNLLAGIKHMRVRFTQTRAYNNWIADFCGAGRGRLFAARIKSDSTRCRTSGSR